MIPYASAVVIGLASLTPCNGSHHLTHQRTKAICIAESVDGSDKRPSRRHNSANDRMDESSGPTFYQLPLEDWESKIIYKIVSTMAEKNLLQLALEKKSMEKKGRQINHVHPMRFIGYVFSDPYLKNCMSVIRKSHFKWSNFVDGFGGRMREEFRNNNLMRHIPEFCQLVGADAQTVSQHIQNKDWDSLVKCLL
jgi:hypothetical protein